LLKQSNFAATSSCSPPQRTLQAAAAARPPHLDAAGAETLDAVIRTPRHAAACRTLKCHRTPWSLHYRVASAQQERGRERIGEGMDLPVTESSRKGDHPFLPSLPPFRSIPAATTIGAPAAAATLRSATLSVRAHAVLVSRLHSSQGRGGPGCVPPGPGGALSGLTWGWSGGEMPAGDWAGGETGIGKRRGGEAIGEWIGMPTRSRFSPLADGHGSRRKLAPVAVSDHRTPHETGLRSHKLNKRLRKCRKNSQI
jgi:hypothetical protein